MRRFFPLVTLVLFLFLGLMCAPYDGESADPVVKKATSNQPVAVKKAPVNQSTPDTKASARQPAKKKTTQPKSAVATKASPAETKATRATKPPVAKTTPAPDQQAAVTRTKSGKKSLKRHAGRSAPTKSKTVSARKTTASPSENKTVHKKKKRADQSSAGAIATTGGRGSIADQISAKSVMVMDAASGEAIFAKAPDTPRQPASTIKIVTGMIALKSLKTNQFIRVSARAAGMPSSKIHLDPGNSYKANDLINAVLLASANDASVALAEGISGSEEQFANLMTMSARMWGATNTICRTASGLTAEGQQSTARDLANLFRYAMRHEDFARRMHERKISTSYGKSLLNHNKALWRIDGAVAGKTGYTLAARQTYVGQFSRDGHTIVVAIMGSESMWADLAKLVNYGFEQKRRQEWARGRTSGTGGERGSITVN